MNAMEGAARVAATPIVVAVDGTEPGYHAVRFAAKEARRLGGRLMIAHVVPAYVPVGNLPMVPDGAFQAHGSEVLTEAVRVAREAVPEIAIDTELRSGSRAHQLSELADGEGLLIVGRHPSRSLDKVWTGGTVTGVVARAHAPVIVVPPDSLDRPSYGRVVVGFKRTAHGRELFDAAFPLASALDAELVVVHAWKLQSPYDEIVAEHADDAPVVGVEDDVLGTALEPYRTAFPGVPVRVHVEHVRPANALLAAAAHADRLVIGKPAHGARVHHLGRTGREVLRGSPCPIEVVPVVPVEPERDETSAEPLVGRAG